MQFQLDVCREFPDDILHGRFRDRDERSGRADAVFEILGCGQ